MADEAPHHGNTSPLTVPAWSDGHRPLGVITLASSRPMIWDLDLSSLMSSLLAKTKSIVRSNSSWSFGSVRLSSWPDVPPLTWRSTKPALRIAS